MCVARAASTGAIALAALSVACAASGGLKHEREPRTENREPGFR